MDLKAKILSVVGAISAFLALWFRGSLHKEKAERAEEAKDLVEAEKKASDKATEALVEGLENEAKKESNPRDYKFGD
jgi:hypothetical protein